MMVESVFCDEICPVCGCYCLSDGRCPHCDAGGVEDDDFSPAPHHGDQGGSAHNAIANEGEARVGEPPAKTFAHELDALKSQYNRLIVKRMLNERDRQRARDIINGLRTGEITRDKAFDVFAAIEEHAEKFAARLRELQQYGDDGVENNGNSNGYQLEK